MLTGTGGTADGSEVAGGATGATGGVAACLAQTIGTAGPGLSAVDQAREIVRHLESVFPRFYPTSGFPSEADFLAALQKGGASVIRAQKLLENENLEPTIATSEEIRDSLAKGGFMNFRSAGTSAGTSAGAVRSREVVEADYGAKSLAEYQQIDAKAKAIYGYAGPTPDSGLSPPLSVSIYGKDRFVLKMNRIRDRLTLTLGDSLNRHMNYQGDETHVATSWDQLFIPWKYRTLVAPALAKGLDDSKLGLHMRTFEQSLNSIETWPPNDSRHLVQLSEDPDPAKPVLWTNADGVDFKAEGSLKNYHVEWAPSLDYLELQYWGPLTLDDVAVFEFTSQPPQGDFLAALRRRGIRIRDGRHRPPVPWVP